MASVLCTLALWLPIGVGAAHLVCTCICHFMQGPMHITFMRPGLTLSRLESLHNTSITSVTSGSSGQVLSLVSYTMTEYGVEPLSSGCMNIV